jgi:signal transduction histidine kinase
MIFRRAKLRLTLWFAAVQLALFAAFGLAVYAYVTSAFDFDAAETSTTTAEASFATLRTGLLLAYAALVVVVPLTSFVLATLAIRPIKAGFEAQQRFVDDASHEFRTPLSAIQAQLELGLNRERPASDYRGAMSRSLQAVSRLNRMIDELLLLSHGEPPTDIHEPVRLSAVIADAVESLGEADRVRVDVTEPVELVTEGSSSMLTRATLNLLTNALRYSPVASRVVVTVVRHGRFARIAVTDKGAGMSRREQRHASERFWRADSSRSREGTGLGLSIVAEIVRLHRGRLRLASVPGEGTTAAVEIPLSR